MPFTTGSTPFGIFDFDVQFATDADKIVNFVRLKLGEPIMDVHMSATQIYASFEEACLEYSSVVNSYQAKSVLGTFLGSPTGTLSGSENTYVPKNLQFELDMADGFGAEADVNSTQTEYTGTIQLNMGQDKYDLPSLLTASLSSSGLPANTRIRVRQLFHASPLSAYRFFGTTSGLNYLNNQFRFESFTPETLFYLLPIWEDVLRGMQFKLSNKVRRSNYSFEMHNNVLTLFPCPIEPMTLYFRYTVDVNPTTAPNNDPRFHGVANLSNVPFGNIVYSGLNSISKHWIRRMSLAFAKEVEGQIRSKLSTIPIPNGDLTLNGPALIMEGRGDQDVLRQELRDILEETTYYKIMEREAQMAQNLQETFKDVPLTIYVG